MFDIKESVNPMRILYLYLNPMMEKYKKIVAGELPSNHLSGYVELEKLGYDISFLDSHLRGSLKNVSSFINKKFGFNLKDLSLLWNLRKFDVVVIKGSFSTSVTIACRLFGKKIVYLDTILRNPKNKLRKLLYAMNLRLASGTIMFSEHQMRLCAKEFNVPLSCFKLIPFSIDMPFFKKSDTPRSDNKPYILSVGQDLARDYRTLVDSVHGLDVDLKIITLPYLLEDLNIESKNIEILSNLTYEQLFHLYAGALFVVLPLKKWGTDYSSGTTSLLEAKALGKAIISTRSLPMMEYLKEGEGVVYVEPEDVPSLRKAMTRFLENQMECMELGHKGEKFVRENYNMEVFAASFGKYLANLFETP
jgi:glycosyltransferase involved in cell wall biosynthesis